MTGNQVIITVAYTAVTIASLAVLAYLVRSTRRRRPVDTERLGHREVAWGALVVVFLVSALAATLWAVPYGELSEARQERQVVRVDAQQFAFAINPATVRAGRPVEFRLTSKDVNHGFGVYRGHVLQAQVQIMPGKEQRLVHTFDRPGSYEILCLEFCGVDHHAMVARLQVR